MVLSHQKFCDDKEAINNTNQMGVIAVPTQMRYKITFQGVGARHCPLVST
ncbi:hypothetical protein GXM_04117 [Nostoc sphaeroides CCNUC1]|uniref:Uncharacterized protein n=1 Tax=Nostoc sphaeroides CCNUC1 TaxID=2653204 RepID=A0A5P8W2Y6_9NOSO|nr:hypothetical protein GXM_04117 [Nostoc sphaeroides CCNUC1]